MKKLIASILALCMAATAFAGCGSSAGSDADSSTTGGDDAAKASIVRDFNRLCVLGVGINGLYALVVVQALFGDLLNPRMCNSLHAMPVTRDGYYGAHLAAGLLFAIVPNCLVFLPTSLFLGKELSCVALWTLLALCLQYIFYLGTALLAVQLAGNRAGMIRRDDRR